MLLRLLPSLNFVRLKLPFAATLTCALWLSVLSNRAFSLSQDEITATALTYFNNFSAATSWDTYLNQYLNGFSPTYPQYEAGLLAWGETYVGATQLAMFDATGNTQYIDLVLHSAETMYDNRADRLAPALMDEIRNKVMPAFISFNLPLGAMARDHAWLVHSGYLSYPVTNAIVEINQNPQLQALYGSRAAALTADITATMDSFDSEFSLLSGGRGVYYEPYLDFYAPTTDGQTPFNMQNAAGLTYLGLWKATGDERFRDRAEALAKTMKAELTAVSDRYRWRYAAYSPASSYSDISHAGLDVSFIVDAYESGIVFDDTDIQRLANTMRHIQVDPGFTPNVDGAGAGSIAQTRLAVLWLKLTRYDAALRQEMLPSFQAYWNQGPDVLATLGTALLYESGQTYTKQVSFQDAFDQLQLDARWRRPATQPIGNTWTTGMTGSQFSVTDIQTTSTAAQWVDILRTRDVDQDDSWEVEYDFTWDSANGAANPLLAMQRFSVDLRDPVGALIASVGFSDAFTSQNGGRVIKLFNQSILDPFNSIAPSGSASIRIVSDAVLEATSIFWNDALLLSVAQAAELQLVGMSFGYFKGAGHFGTITMDSFSVGELDPIPGDYDGNRVVNAADYEVWRANFGSTTQLAADGNGDEIVDAADYIIWRRALDTPAGASVGEVTVPEPAMLQVAFMCLVCAISARRSFSFIAFDRTQVVR
jgi:hypothetical protein